jgi:hypothetical protein
MASWLLVPSLLYRDNIWKRVCHWGLSRGARVARVYLETKGFYPQQVTLKAGESICFQIDGVRYPGVIQKSYPEDAVVLTPPPILNRPHLRRLIPKHHLK